MSVARRWVSGSLANGVRIGVALVVQLASVPIFLSFWSPAQYGVWLVVAGLAPFLTALDLGHQNYLTYAFIDARSDRELGRLFSSSMAAGLVIGLIGIALTLGLVWSGGLNLMLDGVAPALANQAGTLLILQSVVWLFVGSLGGLLVRAMYRIDQYPRTAWWGVASTIVLGAAPVAAVLMGGDLLAAGVWLAAATVVFHVPMLADFARLWLRGGERTEPPDLGLAARNALVSLGITARDLLTQFRQQGVRLALAPAVGVVPMTAFATTRTGANVAVQGLTSMTGPLEPELLGFIRERDQHRLDVAMAVNWILLAALVGPGLIVAQIVMPQAFDVWTRGQIVFDPVLFALLSASVLAFAYAQTGSTIVRGANLVGVQLAASVLAAGVILGGIILTAPALGLRGAAGSLLAAEVCVAAIHQVAAGRRLAGVGLRWPRRLARLALWMTLVDVAALLAMGWAPSRVGPIATGAAVVHVGLCVLIYRALPEMARDRIERPLARRFGTAKGVLSAWGRS